MSKMPEWLGSAATCFECDASIDECRCGGAGAVEEVTYAPTAQEEKDDAMGKVMPIKKDAAAEIKMVHGLEEDKLDLGAMGAAVAKIGLKVGKKAKLPELVLALQEHFAKSKQPKSPCDQCKGVSTLHDFDACPFCGDGDTSGEIADSDPDGDDASSEPEKPEETQQRVVADYNNRAIVHAPVAELVPAGELDEKVAEINRLNRSAASGIWLLAGKIVELEKSELWKSRKTSAGKVAYSKFEEFSNAELKMTPQYAHALKRCYVNFTEKDFTEIGVAKLRMLLQFPKETQQEMLDRLQGPDGHKIGKRDLEKKKKAAKRSKGEKLRGKAAPTNSITVAAIMGKQHPIKLFKRPANRSDELSPAKRLADMPWGHWDLVNDVRVFIAITTNTAGEMICKLDVKRIEPGE